MKHHCHKNVWVLGLWRRTMLLPGHLGIFRHKVAHSSRSQGEIRTALTRAVEIAPVRTANIKMKDMDIVRHRSEREFDAD